MTPGDFDGMDQKSPDPAPKDNINHDVLCTDVMSQFRALNGHTQLVLGFKLKPEVSRYAVTDALKRAVENLSADIPWLHGQVAEKDGILQPTPWPADGPENQIVLVKHCDEVMASMSELLRSGVPIKELDAQLLSPFSGLSEGHKLKPPVPIIRLQANFVHGGLLLTMCFHHIVMDGTAAFQFIRHLASVLEGRRISYTDIVEANRDRGSILRLLGPGEPIKDYSDLRQPLGFTYPTLSSPPAWCYFKLPIAALRGLTKVVQSQLSTSASASTSYSQGSSLLSDNDIICAFCWQRISTIRLSTHPRGTVSKFSRAIDGRLAAGIPFAYMGHMVYHASVRLPIHAIASSSLATVALKLRQALDAVNNEWTVRSYATFIAREPDKSLLLYGGKTNPNTDLGATSALAGEDGSPKSFGPLLGPSCFLRRPRTTPITGSISMSPVEGDYIPLSLCLPAADLEALKVDLEWRRYTKIIG
ncbi:hypothetical protein ACHAPI_011650 [Fusarium lateritium]